MNAAQQGPRKMFDDLIGDAVWTWDLAMGKVAYQSLEPRRIRYPGLYAGGLRLRSWRCCMQVE